MAGKAEKEQELIRKFNQLRSEQQTIANKITELEGELGEHRMVIDTLKDIDPERKCYRLIGGVLVERNVKEVLPALRAKEEGITRIVKQLNEQMIAKGTEINDFRNKHNIKIARPGQSA